MYHPRLNTIVPISKKNPRFDSEAREQEEILKQRSYLRISKSGSYGYAVTVHKSQGGTWDNVVADVSALKKMPNSSVLSDGKVISSSRKSLLYVMASRARKNVSFIADSADLYVAGSTAFAVDNFAVSVQGGKVSGEDLSIIKDLKDGQLLGGFNPINLAAEALKFKALRMSNKDISLSSEEIANITAKYGVGAVAEFQSLSREDKLIIKECL